MTRHRQPYNYKFQDVILLPFKILKNNCCGLDVHKIRIYACIGITEPNNRTAYKQARFSSFTKRLQELCNWLATYNCNDVYMESTGKYWISVFNISEKASRLLFLIPNIQNLKKETRQIAKIPSGFVIYTYVEW